jgi:hypothetical protein
LIDAAIAQATHALFGSVSCEHQASASSTQASRPRAIAWQTQTATRFARPQLEQAPLR